MSCSIIIPRAASFTAAAIVSTVWLTTWQAARVLRARNAAAIDYPQVYAEKAEAEASKVAKIFNCTQRAHQNTLENLPLILVGTTITALNFPTVAAGLCGIWTVSRVLYTIGYGSGDPAGRHLMGGSIGGALSIFGLLFSSTYSAVKLF